MDSTWQRIHPQAMDTESVPSSNEARLKPRRATTSNVMPQLADSWMSRQATRPPLRVFGEKSEDSTMRFDLIPLFLLNPPSRLRTLGHTLINGAGLLLLIGVIAQVAVTAISGLRNLTGGASQVASLAQIYPELPTWWIPEGPLGYLLCAATLGVGLVLTSLASRFQRLMY